MWFFDFGALVSLIVIFFYPWSRCLLGKREQPPNRPPLRPRDVEPPHVKTFLSKQQQTVYTHSLYSCLINIHTTTHKDKSLAA